MPQHARLDVGTAAIRVDVVAVGIARDGIDGEVPPQQVFLQRDVRRELGDEAAVAGAALALPPRQRVLLLRLRMEEHREIPAHGAIAGRRQLLGGAAHHDPVACPGFATQQLIPDRAADQIDLHGAKVQNCAAGRLVLLAAALLQAGCGLGYYAQAARGQFAIMRARQPVERLIDSPGTSDTLRQQLVRARRIRDFASSELGLPDNGAYRSYADIGRRYVVWNVVATP